MIAIQEQLKNVIDELRGTWRFRRHALALAWAVCLCGWAIVFAMPDMYQSSARVFVDTRAALSSVLQGLTIQQDVNAQLSLVRQSLLSRPQLEKIARESDIDLRAETPQARIALIDKLAERIRLTGVDSGAGGIVYSIQYQDPNRQTSLRVVELLVNTLVEGTLGGKRSGSQVAQKFLQQQIEEYEQRLRDAENRLADFKRRNVGLMPGAQGDYFARLQAEMASVEKAQQDLSVAQTRREALERQLRGEATMAASQVPSSVSGMAGGTAAQIRDAQAKVDQLLLQYTEKHPDVIALRDTIAQLEERRTQELAALRLGQGPLPAGAAASPVVQSVQRALNEADVEIAALRAKVVDGQRRIAELRKLVDTAPEVEAEFSRLNRDYDVTRERYLAFVDRAEKAKVGDQAEETDAVRFEVIDPPVAAFEPVSPKRPMLMAAVLVIGLGAGCGLAFLLHLLKPVFTSTRSLNEITGLPVLGVVSKTWLDKYRIQQRNIYIRYSIGAATLVVAFFIVVRFNDLGVRLAHALIG